jgi:fatty acid desaturase
MSLRPFFVYDTKFSTDDIGTKLLQLTQVSWWRGLAAVVLNWSIIVLSICLAGRWDHPLGYLAAIAIVGARQHALLILMHDAAHFRLFPARSWNDRLADWFCAYPHLVSTDAYRHDHLRHHRYLNSDKDPNWVAKLEDAEWQFPKTRAEIAWLFLKDLGGGGLWRMLKILVHYGCGSRNASNLRRACPDGAMTRQLPPRRRPTRDGKKKSSYAAPAMSRLAYFLLAIGVITLLDLWWHVLILWLVPLFTVVPALLRLRVISEHHGLDHIHDMNHSRNYHANLIERFFLAPHNVWLHLDHHLFPAIPHYHLPQAHALLESIPQYSATAHQSRGVLYPFQHSVLYEISTNR